MKLRVTMDVDTSELFDRVRMMKGDCSLIGFRIVGVMLTGDAGFADKIGMAMYGVTIHSVEKLPQSDKIATDSGARGE